MQTVSLYEKISFRLHTNCHLPREIVSMKCQTFSGKNKKEKVLKMLSVEIFASMLGIKHGIWVEALVF